MPPQFDDPLPKVCGIDRSQRLHRIVDFFSAAQAVDECSLYVPLASTFDDANEAIDAAMEVLSIAAGPCAGITTHFGTAEDFIRYQRQVANRNYVSCWTHTKESVAMWALYSRDESSVQLTTTVSHLERAATDFARNFSNPLKAIADGSANDQFVDYSKIVAVRYENWKSIARGIDRRRRAYDKIDAAGRIPAEPTALGRSFREGKRAIQYRFEAMEHKDESFSHEAEVRLILNCAHYNAQTLKMAQNAIAGMISRPDTDINHPDHERVMLMYARALLREEAWKMNIPCQPQVFLPLHSNFVSEVTIDPRCSQHKRQFMKEFFEARGIPVSESTCFGHAAHQLAVKARRRLAAKRNVGPTSCD